MAKTGDERIGNPELEREEKKVSIRMGRRKGERSLKNADRKK